MRKSAGFPFIFQSTATDFAEKNFFLNFLKLFVKYRLYRVDTVDTVDSADNH